MRTNQQNRGKAESDGAELKCCVPALNIRHNGIVVIGWLKQKISAHREANICHGEVSDALLIVNYVKAFDASGS